MGLTTDPNDPDLGWDQGGEGQNRKYLILPEEARTEQGFVRPLRRAYIHSCGSVTTMALEIAQTYARNPKFYSHTFCNRCNTHLPVGQFQWVEADGTATDETVGG